MLSDNNQLVQKIGELVALLSPTQKAIGLTLAEIVTLALSAPPPTVPSASFTHTADGLTVTFANTSTGGASRVWSFGDGLTSTAEHPVHVYSAAGTYCVTLTIANEDGTMSAATLLLTLLGVGGEPEQTTVTSGLLAWWKFRQANGADNVVNAGSNGGTDDLIPDDTGVTAGNSGPNGRTATAADSGLTYWAGDATSSLLQSADYTVALLAKVAGTGIAVVIADNSGTFSGGIGTNIIYFEEDIDLMVSSVTHYDTTDSKLRALVGAGWAAVFVVHDGTTKTTAIYIGNSGIVTSAEDESPTVGVGTRVTTPAQLTVAATSSGGNSLNNDIDDLRIYNRKLSEAEMNTIVAEWGY